MKKIEASNGEFLDDDHEFVGNYNTIRGKNCKVVGNYNAVFGKDANIHGNYNHIHGDNADVHGNYNVLSTRKFKRISGSNNTFTNGTNIKTVPKGATAILGFNVGSNSRTVTVSTSSDSAIPYLNGNVTHNHYDTPVSIGNQTRQFNFPGQRQGIGSLMSRGPKFAAAAKGLSPSYVYNDGGDSWAVLGRGGGSSSCFGTVTYANLMQGGFVVCMKSDGKNDIYFISKPASHMKLPPDVTQCEMILKDQTDEETVSYLSDACTNFLGGGGGGAAKEPKTKKKVEVVYLDEELEDESEYESEEEDDSSEWEEGDDDEDDVRVSTNNDFSVGYVEGHVIHNDHGTVHQLPHHKRKRGEDKGSVVYSEKGHAKKNKK